jgi:hypothetical protein
MSEVNRRDFVKGAVALSAGLAAAAQTGCSDQPQAPGPVRGRAGFPTSRIGNHQVSRLLIGGNPFSGIAHSEPLVYAGSLFRHYFTHEKTVETLKLGVQLGINTFLGRIDDNVIGFLKLYERTQGERMPWFAQTSEKAERGATRQQIQDNIRVAADNGAVGCYLQGASADFLVAEGNLDDVEDHLKLIRSLGMVAGVGAHLNATVEGVEKAGIEPDFYMKTINRMDYYARSSDRTAEIMSEVKAPWIAFKVLAAGRIRPEEGFRYALVAGADFLCVGMFEFQVVQNVELFQKLISEMPT